MINNTTLTRQTLVNSGHLIFRSDQQKTDLLNPGITCYGLVLYLTDLCINKGYYIEVTAIKSDHSNDSSLGVHCHFFGWCIDCWPLNSATEGNYMLPDSPEMLKFLHDAGVDVNRWQIGEAGTAWTHAEAIAAGSSVFHDDGADHIHLGAR